MSTLRLEFPAGAAAHCNVHVGCGVLRALRDEVRAIAAPLTVVVSDETVAALHARRIAGRLRGRGRRVECVSFPAGERSKSRRTKAALDDALAEWGAGRDTLLLAIGGGVTGDLAGFVAATWHRGVPVIQVPTSLLAMVDASIGGKTAINLPSGKNLVGAFHQPRAIYADIDLLRTLPDTELIEGLAEAVKSACVADGELFGWIERHATDLLERRPAAIERLVRRCVEIKGSIVRDDEREAGRRAALNFGHTVGHAIEAVSRFRVRHGRAVAIGMCIEARLARELRRFPERDRRRLVAVLETLGLPIDVPLRYDPEAIVEATRRDKKVRAGKVHYSLPRRIGRMPPASVITTEVDARRLRAALAQPT